MAAGPRDEEGDDDERVERRRTGHSGSAQPLLGGTLPQAPHGPTDSGSATRPTSRMPAVRMMARTRTTYPYGTPRSALR